MSDIEYVDINASLSIDGVNIDASLGEYIGGGTRDYNALVNKPQIEGVVLIGNKNINEIGIGTITEQDIDNLIYG